MKAAPKSDSRIILDRCRRNRNGTVGPGTKALACTATRFTRCGTRQVSIIHCQRVPPSCVFGENTPITFSNVLKVFRRVHGRNCEIIVLHGRQVPAPIASVLEQRALSTLYELPFNWSRAMNQGAALARGTSAVSK